MSYRDNEEIDIVFRHRQHSPVVYPEHRHQTRPAYYPTTSGYLLPETTMLPQRSRSTGHRSMPPPPPPPPAAPPITIVNRVENKYEDDYDDDERYYALSSPARRHSRSRSRSHSQSQSYSHSRSRPTSFTREDYELDRTRRELAAMKLEEERRMIARSRPPSFTREDYELQRVRRELAAYKMEEQRKVEAERVKEELELERLRKEKKAEQEKKRIKEEADRAVKEWQIKEKEKADMEKAEKAERETEYKKRFEEDLRKAGVDNRQLSTILKGEKPKPIDKNRPTYTRMSRRHLSIETLNKYGIDYEFDVVGSPQISQRGAMLTQDQDQTYVLIKRWVPEYEQDFLWNHTKTIREKRQPVLVLDNKTSHHHHHEEVDLEWVRKKDHHKRKPSPSPLLTFFAGGKK